MLMCCGAAGGRSVSSDCVYSSWSVWSACTKTCGSGTTQRTRSILAEATANGTPCTRLALSETSTCNANACGSFNAEFDVLPFFKNCCLKFSFHLSRGLFWRFSFVQMFGDLTLIESRKRSELILRDTWNFQEGYHNCGWDIISGGWLVPIGIRSLLFQPFLMWSHHNFFRNQFEDVRLWDITGHPHHVDVL